MIMDNSFKYVSTAGSATIKVGRGTLERIVVGETSASKIEIYDGVDGDTFTQLGELKASIAEGSYEFNCTFANGLYIAIAAPGGSKVTVVYR